MAPEATDANGVLFESDTATPDLGLKKTSVQLADDTPWAYDWQHVIQVPFLYVFGLYGGYLFLAAAKWQTGLFTCLLHLMGSLGVTAGAHRLWAHKAYKANLPLKLILLLFQTLSMQYSVINWVRDHRMHHKYVDTDADPHNATRGLFFSHVGWLMVQKHPEYERKSKLLAMNDIEGDPMLRFQQKYYITLLLLVNFVLPTLIPVYMWNESSINAFFVAAVFRLLVTYNMTALVNSAAHKWGHKPYDKNMLASENSLLSLAFVGEGFHNYHHTFPWDYKAAELGSSIYNLSTMFIDFFAKIGWAYDMKTVSDELIQKRVERTGDGSHNLWGWGDKDQSKEEVDAAIRIHPKDD
ncbi:acyl-CoA Delta-9 desaturase-like [Cydia pomonella]|uniref:acyl-CoA Delta-9 desaturase-like n=1 Tax=Cydia pomonella TaxID=82600 RepID=UPI002ADDCF66|nr:acyl-CoA Delta-9 desaturase-like [Cydia pomonella]